MLARGTSNRGARAAPTRGTTSRGRGRGANNSPGPSPSENSQNPFAAERLENAAKREQRGQDRGGVGVRGARGANRGFNNIKQVRFASPPEDSSTSTLEGSNNSTLMSSGTNFHAATANGAGGNPSTTINPFATSNPFAASNLNSTNGEIQNPFKTSAQASNSFVNPFASSKTSGSGTPSFKPPFSGLPTSQSPQAFGTTSKPVFSFGSSSPNPQQPNPSSSKHNPFTSLSGTEADRSRSTPLWTQSTGISAVNPRDSPKSKFGQEIDNVLRKNNISAPSWPTNLGTLTLDRVRNGKVDIEAFFKTYKAYRARARACLIQNGYIDDPDKPKKLSEAIDFKGTCEEMCPEFEKISRIMDHDVREAEITAPHPGDDLKASTRGMVKALARSAAGQDAPLPDDIRSPAALRRTVDYLIDQVLGDHDIASVHGFLWDRTRAIRRDFVFQQASMNADELLDHVYCLETITRFHVVALHQMSRQDATSENFSEQQEVEQLGKTLLSLIHAYEDCQSQNVVCENEAEFRAYYVLFNVHNPAILETVQDWGWNYWGESDDIRTAVTLVECLQNIWDPHGPLKPHSATDIAPNMFSRFFTIIADRRISYTMACFAEIHFNRVRKAALKTILVSYRKQRDQTKDWTLDRLNQYLCFDHEEEIVNFGEAYGLHFEVSEDVLCLSITSDEAMTDPLPQLKQTHSESLVERKREQRPLPTAIHQTLFEISETEQQDERSPLFVPESSSWANQASPTTMTTPSSKARSHPPITFPNNDHHNLGQPSSLLPGTDDAIVDSGPSDEPQVPTKAEPEIEDTNSRAVKSSTSTAAPDLERSTIDQAFSPFQAQKSSSISRGPFLIFEENASPMALDSGSTKPSSPFSFLSAPKPNSPPKENHSSQLGTLQTTNDVSHDAGVTKTLDNPTFGLPLPTFGSSSPFTPPNNLPNTAAASKLAQPADSNTTLKEVAERTEFPQIGGAFSEFSNTREDQKPPQTTTSFDFKPEPPRRPKLSVEEFARWFALADGGVIDQFTEVVVHKALSLAVQEYNEEEDRKVAEQKEAALAREVADFRYRSLATKYGHMWRRNAHRKWMKRKGREARAARRQMAEDMRALEISQSKDIVEEFRKSGRNSARRSLEKSLSMTGALDGVHQPHVTTRNIVNGSDRTPGDDQHSKPSPNSKLGSSAGSRTPPKRRTQDAETMHRRSMSSDISMGGSRIHLLPNYSPRQEHARQASGVKTDYFRLKARGILTLPNGTPLANTVAAKLYPRGTSSERDSSPHTPARSIERSYPRSVPSRVPVDHSEFQTSRNPSIEAPRARANTYISRGQTRPQNKRVFDDDDEELFAKAKRLREQLEEGEKWYRDTIEKESVLSRSVS